MNPLKKLAGQTAVYGLSSIVGRFLNYLLVPLYTYSFATHEYGVVTELFAYVVVLQILLTYGMETGFFRFTQKNYAKDTVFSTAATSLVATTTLFVATIIIFSGDVASFIGYQSHPEYIIYFALIIGADILAALPFARLRLENKAKKFAAFKIINITINIGLNLFFILLCPSVIEANPDSILTKIYNPEIGVGYIFISNLVASAVILLLFLPYYLRTKYKFDKKLLQQMLVYSLPLLVTGLSGAINEMADRILLKHWLTIPSNVENANEYVMSQLGIYGANAKIAVLMMMFVQAFRYAAEPFFFQNDKKKDSLKVFADVMKYFVIIALLMFLGVMLYLDVVKYFIHKSYFEGLDVVFPLFLSRIFVGIFFVLSFWYKLKDVTRYGIIIVASGSVITIGLNYFLIPRYGYMGAAWTNFSTYLAMIIISYIWSRKYLPVKYDFVRIFGYFALALGIYFASKQLNIENTVLKLTINTGLLAIFVAVVAYFEKIWKLVKHFKSV